MLYTPTIIIIFILRAVRWFLLIMPIITIYYQANGLTMQEIFIIQACFSLAIILFEIPTGYFSDVVGRKNALVIGMFLGAFGMGFYAFSTGFWSFLAAELILGLGSSFISGTDSAMIYDLLIDEGQQGENKKIQGYLNIVSSLSESSASLIGSLLAVVSLHLPFYVEFSVYVASLPLLFFIQEPKRHKHDNKAGLIQGIKKIILYSLHDHKEIKWLIIFSGFIGASTLVMTWILQSYFVLLGIPLIFYGALWTFYNLTLIPFSFFAHIFERKLGPKYTLIVLGILPIVGYFLLSYMSSLIGLIFVVLFYMTRGLASVILNDYVNILVSSQIRATVLSIQALMYRLVFVMVGPFIGWIIDGYSLQHGLRIAGLLFAFGIFMAIVPLLRYKIPKFK